MGMTMTQKILAAHAGLESVVAGQLIEADLDMVLANDITGPVAIHEVEKLNKKSRAGMPSPAQRGSGFPWAEGCLGQHC